MITFKEFLEEGLKKNQINSILEDQSFKVGLEFEFYNEDFLKESNIPTSDELKILGKFMDDLNDKKQKNRELIIKNKRRGTSSPILTEKDVRLDPVVVSYFRTGGIGSKELNELIYFYIAYVGISQPNHISPETYKKEILQKYSSSEKRIFQKFSELLNRFMNFEVTIPDLKKYYTNPENVPSWMTKPKITDSDVLNKNGWTISPDPSVLLEYGGIEFISNPISVKDALEKTKDMFEYIKQHGHTRNFGPKQCGLHINLSYKPERMKKFDPLKFLVFSNETYNLSLLKDRENAEYIEHITKRIKKELGENIETIEDLQLDKKEYFADILKNNMEGGIAGLNRMLDVFKKHQNINYSHYNFKNTSIRRASSERIEVRYFGGEGYEKNFPLFRQIFLELLYALDVSTDPEKEKNLYLRRVFNLLNIGNKDEPEKPLSERLKSFRRRKK